MNERERIELLMKCYNLSSSQFADKTGIQRASVSHILSGRNKPSLEVMLKIYDAFPGLDMKWLMAGIGDAPVAQASAVKEPAETPAVISTGLFGGVEEEFAVEEPVMPVVEAVQEATVKRNRIQPEKSRKEELSAVQSERRRSSQARTATQPQCMQRKIKEIRIFYTDGTYETLVPEK